MNTSVSAITIRFARYDPPEEWRQQAMGTPLRWLHEAFPIDEILARELNLGTEAIRFEAAPSHAPPYEVIATAADGSELFRETSCCDPTSSASATTRSCTSPPDG